MIPEWAGTIRVAADADGVGIGKLYREARWPDHGVDWTQPGLGQWWLVGDRDGEIRGAVQVIASRPFAYVGDIVVHPDERSRGPEGHGRLGKRLGALAFLLYVSAFSALREAGCEIVLGVVSEHQVGLQKALARYGGEDLGGYRLMARRLR